MGGLGGVVEPGGFLAEGLQPGSLGAESADLLRGRFGDEVGHVGILSRGGFSCRFGAGKDGIVLGR